MAIRRAHQPLSGARGGGADLNKIPSRKHAQDRRFRCRGTGFAMLSAEHCLRAEGRRS